MGKRVGLLGLLLVATSTVGCTLMTGSATPTPLFAPDDIEFVLPRQVGGIALTVGASDGRHLIQEFGLAPVQDLLIPLAKEPGDVRVGVAWSGNNDRGDRRLFIDAIRIDGVEAKPLVEQFYRQVIYKGVDVPEGMDAYWRDVGGRSVWVMTLPGNDWYMAIYPKGEVMFVFGTSIHEPEVTIEDVLAELP